MKTIGLYLMGEKGFSVLNHIKKYKEDALIVLTFVVSSRDKAVQKDFYEEILDFCKEHGIRFFNRQEIGESDLHADYAIAVGWRWMIRDLNFELIVLHDSLLPKYRGFNPLVTALIEGDTTIGVTAIEADKEFDSGDIYAREEIEITYPIKIQEAIEKISELYSKLIVSLIEKIQSGNLQKKKQDESKVSYSVWRNDEDYLIDWNQSADRIERMVHAVGFPYKGAFTHYGDIGIRILEAEAVSDLKIINRKPGKLFKIENNQPVVICGNGMLQIKKAIRDGEESEVVFKKLRVRLQ